MMDNKNRRLPVSETGEAAIQKLSILIVGQKGRKVNDKSKSLTRYAKRSACFLV